LTSDRGLAGAFNSNVIKLAKLTIAEKYPAQYKRVT
jgi:F-type H+-transporting ATPase subunit gamma